MISQRPKYNLITRLPTVCQNKVLISSTKISQVWS